MRPSRFTEDKIVKTLNEQDAGAQTADYLPQARHLVSDRL